MHPWTAELEIDVSRAADLIARQFPALGPTTVTLLGVGWDNVAFLVNDRIVFRFPRRQIGAATLAAEVRVLPALAGRLPVPIPQPCFVGRPDDNYPWLFAGYPFLSGRTACSAALHDQQRLQMAGPLAEVLSVLHAVPLAEARELGAAEAAFDRLSLEPLPRLVQGIEELAARGLVESASPFLQLLDEVARLPPDHSRALLHGDLYVRHLLVNERGALCGLIDWGDVQLGHPAVDLAIVPGFLPPVAHAAFLSRYGALSDATWLRACYRALHTSTLLVHYGLDQHDADLVREGRWSLRNVLASAR